MNRLKRLACGGLAAVMIATAASAMAAAPPANTPIGNQAIATYQNAAGETITVQSNSVQTIVNQVAAVDVEADSSKTRPPGGKIFYPHVITNNGNGPDAFNLSAVDANTGNIDFPAGIKIYPDADRDGVPDSLTPITVTPSLNPGETFGFVVEVPLPTTASPGDSETITVTGTSQHDGTVTDFVTDTAGVSNGPAIELTKSMTPGNVQAGDTVTVTITYSNTGLGDATNVVITDTLPAELSYVANSGAWSDGGTADDAADGTDHTNAQGHSLDYSYDAATTKVSATIDTIPAGRSGSITFQATVVAGAAGSIANIAAASIDGGTPESSNKSTVVVDDSFAVTMADSSSSSAGADPDGANLDGVKTSGTDTDGANDDTVTEDGSNGPIASPAPGAYPQGGKVRYEFVLTNHSNVSETFNLSVTNVSFPTAGVGTKFTFTDQNGVPLTDSDGDGNPDTGPVGIGSANAVNVFLEVDLPDDPSAVRAASDPAWTATVTATASSDPTASNSSTAALTAEVVASTVDIENAGGLADGPNVDNAGQPWTTEAVDPGQTAQFTIVVENTATVASSFDLAYSGSNFNAGAGLPANWQVKFKLSGVEVANTGLIAPGASVTLTAEVTVPAGEAPGDYDIYFRALSPTNGASDVKLDRVTVNTVTDVAIAPDQTTQAAPGGVVVMPHVITNNGNAAVTSGAITLSGYTNASGTLFYDANGDGVLDASDPVISDISDIPGGIAPGASVTIFNRVQVPSTGVSGQSEVGTITVSVAGDSDSSNDSVEDTVTVISGDIELTKEQALDAACTNPGGLSFSTAQLQANPGECIRYRVTARNSGTADATAVTILDSVPAYTTLETCGGACAGSVTGGSAPSLDTIPADEQTGAISASFGTLTPGDEAVLEFTVQIDN